MEAPFSFKPTLFLTAGVCQRGKLKVFFRRVGFARVNPFRFRCRTVQRTCFGTHFFQLSFFFWQRCLTMYQTESSEYTRYAIKQWCAKGGRLLVVIICYYNTYKWDDRVTGVKLSHPTVWILTMHGTRKYIYGFMDGVLYGKWIGKYTSSSHGWYGLYDHRFSNGFLVAFLRPFFPAWMWHENLSVVTGFPGDRMVKEALSSI